jgi:hypothetical protein
MMTYFKLCLALTSMVVGGSGMLTLTVIQSTKLYGASIGLLNSLVLLCVGFGGTSYLSYWYGRYDEKIKP